MKVYNYSPINGEFICESKADESPLEPGVFLIPAHATTIAPLSPKNDHVSVFDGKTWRYEKITVPQTESDNWQDQQAESN